MADPSDTGSVLGTLRAATQEPHARLEGFLAADAFRSLQDYARMLAALLGLHRPLEPALERAAAVHLPALRVSRRADRLAADLRALGRDPELVEDAPRPPRPSGPAEVAGVAYVLEGSTLGGATQVRLARERLGLDPAGGASFFAHPPDARERWQDTVGAIEAAAQVHGADDVARAAEATFAWMSDWLTRH